MTQEVEFMERIPSQSYLLWNADGQARSYDVLYPESIDSQDIVDETTLF